MPGCPGKDSFAEDEAGAEVLGNKIVCDRAEGKQDSPAFQKGD